MFRNLDFDTLGITGQQSELIELTLSFGFKGFDLDIADFSRQVEYKGLDHARRLIDSAHIALGTFPLPVDWDADEQAFQQDLKALGPLVELASQIGCTRARGTIAPAGDLRPFQENFDLYRRRFGEIADVLSTAGVRLGLSYLAPAHYRHGRAYQFVHAFDELLLLVKTIDSSSIGICLDTWHWHVSGAAMDQINALSPQDVVALDVADATTPAGQDDVDESTRVLPGKASEDGKLNIDIPAIMVAMANLDFDGPVTLRPHPSQFAEAKRDQIVRKCGEAMDTLWSAAGLNKKGKLVRSHS
jgi:sugar phosphate isomerase/epimerase